MLKNPTNFKSNHSEQIIMKKIVEEFPVRVLLEGIYKDRYQSDIYIAQSEKPDFIVTDKSKNEVIGIEHVRCYPQRKKHPVITSKGLTKLCQECISELQVNGFFKDEIPYAITVRVPLKLYLYGYTYSKKESIKREIREKIELQRGETSISNKSFKYISDVNISYLIKPVEAPAKISIQIQPDMLIWLRPNKKSIRKAINDKSKKLTSYKNENQDITKWWLCLEIPHNSFISTIKHDLPKRVISEYDGIYVVDMHTGLISSLKQAQS